MTSRRDRGRDDRAASRSARPNTPEGAAKRAALVEAMELKNYEFNAHGVELGQFYESTAVVARRHAASRADPGPRAVLPAVDRAGRRGSRTPGSGDNRRKLSTHDLAPMTRFTLITGIAGEAWVAAAREGRRRPRRAARGRGHRPRAARSPTSTSTGRGCARSTRTARSWSARTSTSAGGR